MQVEKEFETQILKAVSSGVKISRLDSHVHTHAIPAIFKITCKLANKYNIPYVRTQFEKPYFCKSTKLKSINLVKILLLQFFTRINRRTLRKYNLKTNNYILGVGYTGMMTKDTIKSGLSYLNYGITECLIHPCKYDNKENSHSTEFEVTQNIGLKTHIENMGYKLISSF